MMLQASGHSRALGSSQAQLLAPVQQLDSSYVAAVQPQGSAHGVLLTTPVCTQQPKPLLDAEQQLPLPSKLHSLHVLQAAARSNNNKAARESVAAVVLADGTVAAADFGQLCLHPAATSSSSAATTTAAAGSSQQRAGGTTAHRLLSTACSGQLLAVAKQPQTVVTVDIYSASHTSSSSSTADDGDDAAPAVSEQQQQQPQLKLKHSCSIPAPTAASKLVGLSVSHQGLLLVLWSCHTLSVCHSSGSAAATTNMPLPPALAAAVTAGGVNASGGDGSTPAADRSSKRKQRTAAAAVAASGGADWTAVALSEQHMLLVAVEAGGANSSSSCRVHYALLDTTYGSCLSTGAFNAGSSDAAGGRLQLLPLPEHAFAPAALLVHGGVWLLPLQLPKADLAGLVASLGLGSSQAHAAAAAAAPDATQLLLTSRQQLNLAAIAASVSKQQPLLNQQQQAAPCVLQQLRQPQQTQAAAAGGGAGGIDSQVKAAVQQVWQVLEQQKRPAQALQAAVSQLCDVLEQQQQQQQEAASAPPQPKQQRQAATSSVLVSQQLLAAAVSALAEAQEWAVLERLHGLAPLQSLASCADVLPALAAAEQYSAMRSVLTAAQEVPAEAVVRALQHVLQPRQQQQQQDEEEGAGSSSSGPSAAQTAAAQQIRTAAEAVVQQAEANAAAAAQGQADPDAAQKLTAAARHAAAAVDGFTSRELLLHVLLWVQVDVVEAQAALKALPASVVLRLLRYMIKWLHKFSRNSLSARSADALLLTPSAGQVVEWCKLLLDAQLTKLMLMPAAGPLLQQLQRLLRSEVSTTNKLVALKGAADHWAAGAPLPAAAVAANSQYVLELLDLRVVTPTATATGAGGAAAGRRR